VRTIHPEWPPQQVIEQVLTTVDPVPSLAAKTVSGGRLNAAAALGVIPIDTKPPRITSHDPTGLTTGQVDHVRLYFSEPIDASTFDVNDMISLTGPGAVAIPVISVTPVAGNNRQFDMLFDPQLTVGDYELVIGPHIADPAGNELDQNKDGTPGVDGDDNYTATFTIVSTPVFSSPNVPVAINGFAPFGSYLTIDEDLPIADVNVKLNITFPRDGRLAIWLVSPAGTTVGLSYRHGGGGANFDDTIFDDEGDLPIAQGTAPFAGSFQPDEPLSALDDQNAQGTWELFVQNVSTMSNYGSLNSWSLDISPDEEGDDCPGGPGCDENDPPVAVDDTVTAIQDTPLTIQPGALLANDSDPNDHPLSIVSVGNAIGGSAELNSDGTILFTPALGGLAPGSFQYVITDGFDTAMASVQVNIQPLYIWHNLNNGHDVNNDGTVSPIDALLVINRLNAYGPTPIEFIHSLAATTIYYDVVPDNYIASNDALAVINYLNGTSVQSLSATAGEGEGEAASGAASAPSDVALEQFADFMGPQDSSTQSPTSHLSPVLLLSGSSTGSAVRQSTGPAARAGALPIDEELLDAAAIDQCLDAGEVDSLVADLRLLSHSGN
jgi:subtilisin-like proprotein convertase family protein